MPAKSESSSRAKNNFSDVAKPLKPAPQPRWFFFQILNFVVIGVFVGSVSYVAINYKDLMSKQQDSKSPITNMFFPVMVLWALCLVYFFGFFGISFVDKDALTESPSSFGLEDMQAEALQQRNAVRSQGAEALFDQTVLTHGTRPAAPVAPQPRHDTPICAEAPAASTARPRTSSQNNEEDVDYTALSDEQVLGSLLSNDLKDYQLEKKLGDYERAVCVRRKLYEHLLQKGLANIPYLHYDYNKVFGANCEIVVGYVPIPLGIVGPIVLNGEATYVPMATTEGCLVASTNRGCKAISASGGACAVVLKDAITRAPCVKMPSAMRAAALKLWVGQPENYALLEAAFNSTTNFGRLHSVEATVAGRNVYLRFACMSGDAMGMNMVSKGCLKAIDVLTAHFPDLVLVTISGNMCTDKKPSAINWILGRGKSIVVEATIPEAVVKSVLKSNVEAMIETNRQKNLIGSAMAGSIGGFNAHAANIVTAVYLATGQDPAQNVESSNCMTVFEYADDHKSLHVSVTMPSVEVGTVGGGTHLPAQAACLDICGVRGASKGPGQVPGDNSRKLAQIVGGAVLAGELSLIAALAANHLVQSHMQHNRKTTPAEPEPAPAREIRRFASMPDFSHNNAAASAN